MHIYVHIYVNIYAYLCIFSSMCVIHVLFNFGLNLTIFFPFSWSSVRQQVSSSLLSILTVLNNPFIWMVSTRPPTSNSSVP